VRLLVDGHGGKLGDLQKDLEAAGVICKIYRPIRLHTLYRVGRRTHRKLLLVDGKIGYTGIRDR